MRRTLWLALGAVVGVLVVRRLTSPVTTAPATTAPTGAPAATTAAPAGLALADSGDDLGMATREAELRAALGVEAPSRNGETPAPSPSGEVP